MRIYSSRHIILFCGIALFMAFSPKTKSLYEAYENDFLMGAALNTSQIFEKNPEEAALIRHEFNAYTPENVMKAEVIHPEWNTYNFAAADQLVELGRSQHKQVNGHTLIWHNQLSGFARRIKDVDSFRTFFRDHITTIASRYNGRISSWDVVNEALNEDGTLRKSIFLEKLGDQYVTEAFRLAQTAAPKTELYYNDYNNEQPLKREGCIRLIKEIQKAGVRIDGVGIQGHWHLGKIPLKDIEESIIQYHALGLKVMITELDIEMLPRNMVGADPSIRIAEDTRLNPYVNGIPDSLLQQQARDYASLFGLFLKHRNKISRVTFWGVHDRQSWLNNWPVRGRTNYPLLFDRALKPKPAYQSILELKELKQKSVTVEQSPLRLPRIFRDSMILQRDQVVPVWGWAAPGEKITVEHKGKKYTGMANEKGEWKITLAPTAAGGPHTLLIKGKTSINLKEVLFGDVWFCSGQSNMVHQMNIHDVRYAKDIAEANHQEIRQFLVPTAASLNGPKSDLTQGNWVAAVGDKVRPFSAVAYFFAKELYEKYHVPIGIINASVGGTPAEAWMSEDAAAVHASLKEAILRNKDTAFVRAAISLKPAAVQAFPETDRGIAGEVKWFQESYQPNAWRDITVPGYWEDLGHRDLDGVVWFRKEFMVPERMKGKASRLFLGRIVDADDVYINGVKIGFTTYQYPQRRYAVPEGVLKPGRNLLVVKVTNYSGKGGFVPDKPYALVFPQVNTADNLNDISFVSPSDYPKDHQTDLRGDWQYKVGQVFVPNTNGNAQPIFNPQLQPAALFNGMVSPVLPYPIKGICWYQGESNVSNPLPYKGYMTSLIRDWRKQWGNDSLPFLYVQLPGFMDVNHLPSSSNWALIREAQMKTLEEPKTAMAVAIDLGEWNDIHPDNKKDVGIRLSLAAKALAYKEVIEYSGPMVSKVDVEEQRIVISFDHASGGLMTSDGEAPGSFAIAGADKKFVLAHARISGDKVMVWSNQVSNPKFVRYAWAENPDQPNLCNRQLLPASPFRTDNQ